jgi:uncharacterized UBP type Zn finger protein
MLHSIALIDQTHFKINKPLLIPENQAHDVAKYSMTWHEIFLKIPSCSNVQVNVFTYSLTNVIVLKTNLHSFSFVTLH